jgi:hypothetical protein
MQMRQDRAVSIAAGYKLDERWVGVYVPVALRIFLFSALSRPALGHTEPSLQWAPSPVVMELGCEADH